MIYAYMIPIYAFLVKHGKRRLEDLPESYQIPVAEYLANEADSLTAEVYLRLLIRKDDTVANL